MDKNLYESPEWDRLESEYYDYEKCEGVECSSCGEDIADVPDGCPFCGSNLELY